jgi:type IV pilus assembly protein PilV
MNQVIKARAAGAAKQMQAPVKAQQRGVTLIEILITVLILSFGMLGMAALQTRALQGNQSSGQRSQAIVLSNYILDVMRVDRESAKGGDYNTGAGGAFICGPAGVSGSTLAKNTLKDWLTTMETNLGAADDDTTCGSVECDAAYVCTVKIKWDDSKAGGLADQSLVVQAKI